MTSAVTSLPVPDAEAAKRGDGARLAPYYVWEVPVRLSHWLIALSIFTLSFTGFYIGRPFIIVAGEPRYHFVMGTMKAIHFYAAIAFTLAVLMRVIWMFAGNHWARWHQFVPTDRQRMRQLVQTFFFYSFLRVRPPDMVGHSALAGAAYALVFVLYLLEIATGLALYSANAAVDSPLRIFGFLVPLLGGLQSIRWLHHVIMWLLLGFFVHHLTSAMLMSSIQKNGTMEGMFSGWKFATREQVDEDLGSTRQ